MRIWVRRAARAETLGKRVACWTTQGDDSDCVADTYALCPDHVTGQDLILTLADLTKVMMPWK